MNRVLVVCAVCGWLLLPHADGAASKRAQLSSAEMNLAFGIALWADHNLWDDEDEVCAKRLEWAQESKTTTQSSYRLYPTARMRVLGVRPHSLALYAEHSKVTSISMVFSNKGDSIGLPPADMRDYLVRRNYRQKYKRRYSMAPAKPV